MEKKVMRLVNPSTGLMECKVCGATHQASTKSGGGFYLGSLQCQHGSKVQEPQEEPPYKSKWAGGQNGPVCR